MSKDDREKAPEKRKGTDDAPELFAVDASGEVIELDAAAETKVQ